MTSVGFCIAAMTLATVNVFPDPVTPKSVWQDLPFLNPSTSFLIASG